jgi:DNA-binding MurR/RpiR family transcriptional regulator
VEDETAAMQRLVQTLPQQEIDDIARRMLEARRVYLFGPPYAQTVLALLDRRLRRLGIDAKPLPLSGRLMAEHLVGMDKDDLLLSFVFRRPEPRLGRILGYAQSLGAGTAVIADEEGLSFDPRPDQVLVARRGPSADQRSLMVPTMVVYALQAAIVHAAGTRTVQALRLLDDLARVVGDDEPSHFA